MLEIGVRSEEVEALGTEILEESRFLERSRDSGGNQEFWREVDFLIEAEILERRRL